MKTSIEFNNQNIEVEVIYKVHGSMPNMAHDSKEYNIYPLADIELPKIEIAEVIANGGENILEQLTMQQKGEIYHLAFAEALSI